MGAVSTGNPRSHSQVLSPYTSTERMVLSSPVFQTHPGNPEIFFYTRDKVGVMGWPSQVSESENPAVCDFKAKLPALDPFPEPSKLDWVHVGLISWVRPY